MWNLFRANVLKELGEDANFAVMNLAAGKLSVIIFHKGSPHFMRLKDLGKLDESSENGGIDIIRVLRELNASLVYYRENFSSSSIKTVYISGDAGGIESAGGGSRREIGDRRADAFTEERGAAGCRSGHVRLFLGRLRRGLGDLTR